MISPYDIRQWYWIVGGNGAEVYSSAAKAYLPATDPAYVTWLADDRHRPTAASDETALVQVFTDGYPDGWPALRPTTLAPLAFLARFTAAEQTALATGAQGNATILLFILQLVVAQSIDLTDRRTIAGVNALVAAGLLDADRVDAILLS